MSIQRLCLAILCLFSLLGTTARAQAVDLCASTSATNDQTITACTQQIQSGTLTGKDLGHAYNNRGTGYAGNNQNDLAMADYNQALKIDPTNPQAYHNRGLLYQAKGQLDLAIADFTQALRIDPNYAHAYLNRGRAYHSNGQDNLAIPDYVQAIRIDPSSASAFFDLARAYDGTGRSDLAVDDYTQALKLDTKFTNAYSSRGYSEYVLGRPADAATDIAVAISLDRTYAYPVLLLHIIRSRMGTTDTAEFSTNAAALGTQWPAPIVSLYQGKTTAAQTLAAAQTDGQRCEARFYIAEWRLMRKESAEARSGFKEAVAICPSSYSEAFIARAELKR